jgi:hypothetical protein
MAALAHSRATLRVFGDELQPEEISALLGARPTTARYRGQRNEEGRGPAVWRTGSWRLSADDADPADPDQQVAQILDQLTADLAIWQSLVARFKIDMFCGWFMDEQNEGVRLSAHTLRLLGERGILLDLDLYGSHGGQDSEEA